MEEKYIISRSNLLGLLRDSYLLNALEEAGVDNWEGYGINFEDYLEDSQEEDDEDNEDMDFYDLAYKDLKYYQKFESGDK